MGLIQEKLSRHKNRFENTKFNIFSRLGLPDIFMNIMPCCRFYKSPVSIVILTYHSTLVTYYLFKVSVIVEIEEGVLDNITISVKSRIDTVSLNQ